MSDTIQEEFSLIIVSPDETMYEGVVRRVLVPGTLQELAILPDHTPLYTVLTEGVVAIDAVDGSTQEVTIDGGVLRARSNSVTIITGFDVGDEGTLASTSSSS